MRKSTPLRNLRRARTLNQASLAGLVGISQQSLSKIEKGILVPSIDVQARIAAVLGVSRAQLGFRGKARSKKAVTRQERIPA